MPDKILNETQVKERTGVRGRTTLWRWEREGRFPKRRQVGPNRIGWLESEIAAWIESRPKVGEESGSAA